MITATDSIFGRSITALASSESRAPYTSLLGLHAISLPPRYPSLSGWLNGTNTQAILNYFNRGFTKPHWSFPRYENVHAKKVKNGEKRGIFPPRQKLTVPETHLKLKECS